MDCVLRAEKWTHFVATRLLLSTVVGLVSASIFLYNTPLFVATFISVSLCIFIVLLSTRLCSSFFEEKPSIVEV